MKHTLWASLVLLLSGCASVPDSPSPTSQATLSGPSATLADSQISESITRAQFFVVTSINGVEVNNSIKASLAASKGKGMALTVVAEKRPVTAGQPITTKLRGTHLGAAPIQGIIGSLAGTDYLVDAEVRWTPAVDGQYVVRGALDVAGSSIWIEDERTGTKVTDAVVGPAALTGPTPTFEVPDIRVSFACGSCEVRPDAGARIWDSYKRTAIKAGARVRAEVPVDVVVETYHARPDLARVFLAFTMKNDEIKARVKAPEGDFVVEDYYRTSYLGADSLAANIGELVFKGLAKTRTQR